MTMPEATETTTTYQPTPEQKERAAALKRFNRLFVYTPVALTAIAVLTLVGLMFWQALPAGQAQMQRFTSALADIIIIFTILPMMLLCAIVPGLAIGVEIYRRKQPERAHGRVQTLFWRLDQMLDTARQKIDAVAPRLTNPIIKANARVTYLATLWEQFMKNIKRS